MPGPSSRAMIWIPQRPFDGWPTIVMTISPFFAWSTMLRATSEMAVAISVTSAPLKPSSSASERPRWRAVTISTAEWIGVVVSVSIDRNSLCFHRQIGEAFLEIQRGAHSFERQAQLNHGKSDVRLNADDHG